jgi:hypothetical protein
MSRLTETTRSSVLRSARLAPVEAARRLRRVLASPEYRTEKHRKAALRTILHEAVVGLDAPAAEVYLEEIRTRFPDRVYESTTRLRETETRLHELESAQKALVEARQAAEARLAGAQAVVTALLESGPQPDGLVATMLNAEGLQRLAPAARRLAVFVAAQESALAGLDETLGRGGAAAGAPVAELLATLARGETRAETVMAELDRRFNRLQLLPAALLAGAQQSWKGGTQALLESLDPRRIEEEVSARFPGLREAQVLKEQKKRFEQFWDDLDKNIEHYYREVFRRIYVEKMEGRT